MRVTFLAQLATAAAILAAAYLIPASARSATVPIHIGQNVSTIIASNPPGTTFQFDAGTYPGQTLQVSPTNAANIQGDIFIGAGGAGSSAQTIFDGQYMNAAFCYNYNSNVQIQNMVIEHYMAANDTNINDYEVYAGQNWVLTNVCIDCGGSDGIDFATGCVMNGGEVKSCGHRGIGFLNNNGGNNVTLSGVEIAYNNTQMTSQNGSSADAAGLKGGACSGIVVAYCYVHDNHSVGIWADEGCSGWFIHDNDVQHNDINGIMYEISTNGSIYNNLVSYNGGTSKDGVTLVGQGQILIANSQNTNAYLNTVTAGPTQGAIYLQSDGSVMNALTLQNNGLSRNNVTFTGSGFYGLVVNGSQHLGTGNYSDSNNFHVIPGVGTSEFLWGTMISQQNTTNFATYRSTLGEDTSSTISQY